MYLCHLVITSPWKKAMSFLEQTLIHGCSVSNLFEIGPGDMKKKTIKMWRIYNDDNDNNRQILIRKTHLDLNSFCSGELKSRLSSDMFSKFSQSKMKVGNYTFLRILATCSILMLKWKTGHSYFWSSRVCDTLTYNGHNSSKLCVISHDIPVLFNIRWRRAEKEPTVSWEGQESLFNVLAHKFKNRSFGIPFNILNTCKKVKQSFYLKILGLIRLKGFLDKYKIAPSLTKKPVW